jgi:hypothetical protein
MIIITNKTSCYNLKVRDVVVLIHYYDDLSILIN